jgi:hypothetical protein
MPVDIETYEQEALAELDAPARSADTQALAELRDELRAQRAEASRVYRGSPSLPASRSSSRSPTSSRWR